jgi:cytochrome c oxidase subunit III
MTDNAPVSPTPTLDVSHLPSAAMDYRSPVWWGNLWLLVIESTMFALLIASYFYVRLNFPQWPPPRVDRFPILYDALPDLPAATANIAVLLLLCVPAFIADRACFKLNQRRVNFMLPLVILLGLVSIALRFLEFPGLHFRWDDNAYGSVIWTILVTHLLHLIVATLETVMMASWTFRYPLSIKHARDVRLTAIYWYWIAGMWVLLYAIVYWGPRVS